MSTKCSQLAFTNSYQRNAKYYFYTAYITSTERKKEKKKKADMFMNCDEYGGAC